MMQSKWFYPALIVLMGAVVYANSLQNGFTFDDWPLVAHNPLVMQPDLGAIFSSAYWPNKPNLGLYRPLTTLSYGVNRWILGAGASGFHLVNVVLHLVNALLLFVGAQKILARSYAGFCALIFLIHPLQTEAVNSIVGRAELLATFWMLVAWALFVYGAKSWRWYGIALAIFLGCLCKEHAAMMVGVLALADFIGLSHGDDVSPDGFRERCHRFYQESLGGVLLCVGAVGLFLWVRYAVVGAVLLPSVPDYIDNPLAHVVFWERWLTALGVILRYGGLMFLVGNLSADYSFQAIPMVSTLWSGFVWGGLAVVLCLIWLVVRAVQKPSGKVWALAALWIVMPALPIANLLFPIGTVMAERLMYVPMIGFALMWGICFSQIAKERYIALAIACVLLIGLGQITRLRNKDWQSDYTLFASAVQAVPNSAKAHFNLGNAIRDRGEKQAALSHYHQALWIYQQYAEVHYNVGVIQQDLGKNADALTAYENTLTYDPTHIGAWTNVGVLFAQQGIDDKAMRAFEKAVQLDSTRVDVRFNYAMALQQLDRVDDAVVAYRYVLDKDPNHEDATINLAEIYVQQGDVKHATEVLSAVVMRNESAYQAALNLAMILEKDGRYTEALDAMLKGAEGSDERNVLALFGAARLYGRLGKLDEARETLAAFVQRWKGDRMFIVRAQKMLDQLNVD